MVKSSKKVIDIANAFYQSAVLFAALDAGIFDYCSQENGCSIDQLAEFTKKSKRALRLLLDGCVAIGLLQKDRQELYQNTQEANLFLCSQSPYSLANAIRYNRDVYPVWGELGKFLDTGEPVRKPTFHLGDNWQTTRQFVWAMHSRAIAIGRSVIDLLDLNGARSLLDVGGGPGTYAGLCLQRNPNLHAIVIDLPPILQIAQEIHEGQPWRSRLTFLPGSYLEIDFPTEQDVLLFFGMFHQHSPQEIQHLLKKGFQALRSGGKVYVLDLMTDSTRTRPRFSALFAINMALTAQHGWVFSDREMRQWLKEAGFVKVIRRSAPPPMPHWLMMAMKP